ATANLVATAMPCLHHAITGMASELTRRDTRPARLLPPQPGADDARPPGASAEQHRATARPLPRRAFCCRARDLPGFGNSPAALAGKGTISRLRRRVGLRSARR